MLLVGLYAWAWRHAREVRPQCARYVAGFSAGALVWGASLLVPEPARYGLWVLGIIVVEIATSYVMGYSEGSGLEGAEDVRVLKSIHVCAGLNH